MRLPTCCWAARPLRRAASGIALPPLRPAPWLRSSLIGFVAASPAVTTPTVATIMHDGIINAAEVKDDTIFDAAGRYIMTSAVDRAKPMASFLPGVGGLWGVPMWAFYVNRGQGMATFGIENKEGGLLLFQTAEKSYQATANVGFRTLLKGTRKDKLVRGAALLPESDADAAHTAARTMYLATTRWRWRRLILTRT